MPARSLTNWKGCSSCQWSRSETGRACIWLAWLFLSSSPGAQACFVSEWPPWKLQQLQAVLQSVRSRCELQAYSSHAFAGAECTLFSAQVPIGENLHNSLMYRDDKNTLTGRLAEHRVRRMAACCLQQRVCGTPRCTVHGLGGHRPPNGRFVFMAQLRSNVRHAWEVSGA